MRGQIALARSPARARRCRSDGPFGLHPALRFLHESYAAKELAVLHAVASPYRERSHFDAQNVLESGELRAAWLHERLDQSRADRDACGKAREAGVALGANVPLAMRGSGRSGVLVADENRGAR